MNITYDSYNDIKNKCENYDLYTSDFIYGDNTYSLKNINDMMTMTLKIKNKYTISILNNLPSNLDNLIIHMNKRKEKNNFTGGGYGYGGGGGGVYGGVYGSGGGGGLMQLVAYGGQSTYLTDDYKYLGNFLTNVPNTLKNINFYYYNYNNNYKLEDDFKFLFNIKIPLNCEINLHINDDKYKFSNSDNLHIQTYKNKSNKSLIITK
jgi:hypothetical protein